MSKLLLSTLLIMLPLLFISGCQNTDVSSITHGTYDNIEDNSKYGNVDLTIDGLNGEIEYTFNVKKDVKYEVEYDIHIEEGDFKIEIFSGEELLEETLWTSTQQKDLESEHKDKNPILHRVGGIFSLNNVNEPLSIVIHGKEGTGEVIITW